MKTEKIRMEIAIANGDPVKQNHDWEPRDDRRYFICGECGAYDSWRSFSERGGHAKGPCPGTEKNYPENLNALAEAVEKFRYPRGGTLWAKNYGHLQDIVARDFPMSRDCVSFQWEVANASAIQRAEAYLRTINKWEE